MTNRLAAFANMMSRTKNFVSHETRSYAADIAKGGRRAARWVTRTTPNTPGTSRQAVRRRLFSTCAEAVAQQNPSMPRRERRNLARAYAKGLWDQNHGQTAQV